MISILKPRKAQTATGNAVDVWIVAGQSNPDGRVALGSAPSWLSGNGNIVPDVLMWNRDLRSFGDWEIGASSGYKSGADAVNHALWGFPEVVMYLLAQELGTEQKVVKCTRGGTALYPTHANGTWSFDLTSVTTEFKMLYYLKDRIEDCRNRMAKNGQMVRFKGMIWHQGESDDANVDNENNWQSRMEIVIAEVRKYARNAALPVIMGTISTASGAFSATIKTGMENIAAADANAYLYDCGAATLSDGLHFDADACINNMGPGYKDIIINNDLHE